METDQNGTIEISWQMLVVFFRVWISQIGEIAAKRRSKLGEYTAVKYFKFARLFSLVETLIIRLSGKGLSELSESDCLEKCCLNCLKIRLSGKGLSELSESDCLEKVHLN